MCIRHITNVDLIQFFGFAVAVLVLHGTITFFFSILQIGKKHS